MRRDWTRRGLTVHLRCLKCEDKEEEDDDDDKEEDDEDDDNEDDDEDEEDDIDDNDEDDDDNEEDDEDDEDGDEARWVISRTAAYICSLSRASEAANVFCSLASVTRFSA